MFLEYRKVIISRNIARMFSIIASKYKFQQYFTHTIWRRPKNIMFYTYIIQSQLTHEFYRGYTELLPQDRLKFHNTRKRFLE